MKLLSPAKLNLFLHVTGRRPDGYHELQTLFQLLDFGDDMVFEPHRDGEISLQITGNPIPPGDNLAVDAARLLQRHTGTDRGAQISLHKRIPVGGGLGGGSSNAATTLLALNQLWKLKLSISDLATLGLELGADVPVFIEGKTAWAEGLGERLREIETKQAWYLVLRPGCSVSTAEIFSRQELTRNTSPITIAAFFQGGGQNDCEPVVARLYPEVKDALDWLNQHAQARLTGTGSCLYAAFDNQEDAEAVYNKLPGHMQAFLARGIARSPVHSALAI